jgi:hypothetical protein
MGNNLRRLTCVRDAVYGYARTGEGENDDGAKYNDLHFCVV